MKKVPLVLVSGMLCDRHTWSGIAPLLEDHADLIYMELDHHDSVDAMVDHLLSNTPDAFALAGHSLGGRVVFQTVRRARERVKLLGLIGTAYRGVPEGEAGEKERAARLGQLDVIADKGMDGYARHWAGMMVHPDRRGEDALMAPIAAMAERVGADRLRAHISMGLSRPDATDLMPTIDVPTVIVCGEQDMGMNVATHREMHDAIPNSTLHVIPDAGHMFMLERPAETARPLIEWLHRWPETS